MSDDDHFRNSIFAVRPLIFMMQEGPVPADGGVVEEPDLDAAWPDLKEAPIEADDEFICMPCDDVVQDDEGVASQINRSLPEPKPPSRDEVRKHNLTHWPYRNWCPWCVMGRRNADPHFQSKESSDRSLPLLVLDYAFLRNKDDDDFATVLVGKCYPSRQILACVLDGKGLDELAINRVAAFIRECGLTKFVWKSDQERALRALMEEAIKRSGRSGSTDPVVAVPEASPVGSSASNGRAERTVQALEDQLRTLKAAFESHIGVQLPCTHPVIRWLVHHCADVMNKSAVNRSGITPYEELHGRKPRERRIEFGERVFYSIPKQGRAKLDARWKLGTFLGHTATTNEHFIGTRHGNVLRARSCVRVVEPSRWDRSAIDKIVGVPGAMNPGESDEILPDDVEGAESPHDFAFEEVDPGVKRAVPAPEEPPAPEHPPAQGPAPAPPEYNGPKRVRITQRDLDKHQTTPGCPRCADLDYGNLLTKKAHNEECRDRFYKIFKAKNDAKWARAAQDLQRRISRGGDLYQPDHFPQPSVDVEAATEDLDPPPAKKLRREATGSDGGDDDDEEPNEPDAKRVRLNGGDDEDEDDVAEIFGDFDDHEHASDIAGSLTLAGVTPKVASVKARDLVDPDAATFLELYGRGSICHEANQSRKNLNVCGLGALDLRTTKPDGSNWDFSKKSDRREARDLVLRTEPDFIIGSPPCTAFCAWNHHMNFRKMDPARVRAMLAEGRMHLEFMATLYQTQLKAGRFFVHEHPATAVSWDERCITKILAHHDVHLVKADQCQFGLTTPGPDGCAMPALKPTKFMTNSKPMAEILCRTCDRSHKHQSLTGGRCANAAFYPLPLVKTLIKGIRLQKEISKSVISSMIMIPVDKVHAVVNSDAVAPNSKCPKLGGGHVDIMFDPRNFKPIYRDEYTNEVLPEALVRAAICEELAYFNDKVWQVTDMTTAQGYKDAKVVRCRWVLVNKGDATTPDVRARLVACEINHGGGKEEDYYASTPPLEALKLLFAKFANSPVVNGEPMRLGFVDAKKAYFNGIPKRNVFMRLPREMGLPSHMVGLQVRCVYGTRDAGSIWEDCYRHALESAGFRSGVASPCVFFHEARNIACVVHGDYFTSLGSDSALDWVEGILAKAFDIKVRGRLGVGCDGPNEIRVLNRIVRVSSQGLEYEADPRHADLITHSLKLENSKAVSTPGVKNPDPGIEAEKCSDEVTGPKDLLDLLCALTSDTPMVSRNLKSVTINEVAEYKEVIPYSHVYGWLPSSKVATAHGWKIVSPRSCHFTGKSTEVMRARLARRAKVHKQESIDIYRRTMLRVVNVAEGERRLVEPCGVKALIESIADEPNLDYHDDEPEIVAAMNDADSEFIFAMKKGKPAAKYAKRAGAKAVKAFEREVGAADKLGSDDATTYRAISARSNYLAQDRPDCSYASKELCREFGQPNGQSLTKLKRLGRYYVGKPRLVLKFDFAAKPAEFVEVYCDTDFAGCTTTRRSTSGGCALVNGALVKHWSRTQPTIALSSGEAELSGIGSGMAQALGVQAIAADMGWELKPRVYSDATAAIGISKRRGLGKVRHLHTCDLWVQEQTRTQRVLLEKVLGTENPADIFTKYLDQHVMTKALDKMNCDFREGRAAAAPDTMGLDKPT